MSNMLKDELLSLQDKLLDIEKEFEDKIKEVDEKTEMFRILDRKIEEVKKKDKTIKINVGGKLFVTKLSLLTSVKDSLFYNLIASHLKQEKEIPTEIFFDRNYTFFPVILEFLRYNSVSLRSFPNKYDKLEIREEMEFYGLDSFLGKKSEIDIEWDQSMSKQGACTVNISDKKILNIHSTTCYTHFLTNTQFTTENFIIEFETTVTQTDNYYYIGIHNETYSTTGSCGCCNPPNAYYIQCDGSIHISGTRENSNLSWNSQKCIIGMKVLLSEREIYFYKDSPENETGPYKITNGTSFKVYSGHCNSGNGTLSIINCYSI